MIKKSKTNILWLALALIVMSPIGLIAKDWQTLPSGEQAVTDVTTRVINKSTKFGVRLQTQYENINYNVVSGEDTYYPLGDVWVGPGGELSSGSKYNVTPRSGAWATLEYAKANPSGTGFAEASGQVKFKLPEINKGATGSSTKTETIDPFKITIVTTPRYKYFAGTGLTTTPNYWPYAEYTITIEDTSK